MLKTRSLSRHVPKHKLFGIGGEGARLKTSKEDNRITCHFSEPKKQRTNCKPQKSRACEEHFRGTRGIPTQLLKLLLRHNLMVLND